MALVSYIGRQIRNNGSMRFARIVTDELFHSSYSYEPRYCLNENVYFWKIYDHEIKDSFPNVRNVIFDTCDENSVWWNCQKSLFPNLEAVIIHCEYNRNYQYNADMLEDPSIEIFRTFSRERKNKYYDKTIKLIDEKEYKKEFSKCNLENAIWKTKKEMKFETFYEEQKIKFLREQKKQKENSLINKLFGIV